MNRAITAGLALIVLVGVCPEEDLWAQEGALALLENRSKDIESTILTGNLSGGMVLSGSALHTYRDSPAFDDVSNAVFRSFAGVPPSDAVSLLSSLGSAENPPTTGLGWFTMGLLARAAMKPASAAAAFQEAVRDTTCSQIPMTHAMLGQSLVEIGDATRAASAFNDAVTAAANKPNLLFQVRRLQAMSLKRSGNLNLRNGVLAEASGSNYPFEQAWALEQEAQEAWREGDIKGFSDRIEEAVATLSSWDSPGVFESQWQATRWTVLNRHLNYAGAILAGSTKDSIVFDYETSLLDVYEGDLESASDRLEPWVREYPMAEVDGWSEDFKFWCQRTHLFYNNLLGRTGKVDEALSGFQTMIVYARDTDRMTFLPHIHGQMAYCLSQAGRLQEARDAYETALSVLDTPGEVVNPEVAYNPNGRIQKQARMNLVANYRGLLNRLREGGK